MRQRTPTQLLAVVAVALLGTSACAPALRQHEDLRGGWAARSADVAVLPGPAAAEGEPVAAVASPGRLVGKVDRAELAVVSARTLRPRLQRRIARTAGVDTAVPVSLATAPVGELMVTVAAVDPASYRRLTPRVVARNRAVWERVAEGELALSPELAQELRQPLGGRLVLGNAAGALGLRVGAHASMAPRIDAVVNRVRGAQLGMLEDNAVLASTDGADAATVAQRLRRRLGRHVTVSVLGEAAREGQQTAFLTGGSVAQAVGSFRYRYFPDGTVAPDPAWVAANVRTEHVPILGEVTCHRVMLPQLRAALEEVVQRGLAAAVDPSDYGGCYVPRFIGHDRTKGLSLHTWGIAVDLNVQGNLRGTTGAIDREVVAVFKRWGFAWGGDWAYSDPMHFELAALVRAP